MDASSEAKLTSGVTGRLMVAGGTAPLVLSIRKESVEMTPGTVTTRSWETVIDTCLAVMASPFYSDVRKVYSLTTSYSLVPSRRTHAALGWKTSCSIGVNMQS